MDVWIVTLSKSEDFHLRERICLNRLQIFHRGSSSCFRASFASSSEWIAIDFFNIRQEFDFAVEPSSLLVLRPLRGRSLPYSHRCWRIPQPLTHAKQFNQQSEEQRSIRSVLREEDSIALFSLRSAFREEKQLCFHSLVRSVGWEKSASAHSAVRDSCR